MKRSAAFSCQRLFLFALALAVNYFLMPLSISDSDSAMAILLFLMPLVTLLTCFAHGCGHQATWLLPLLSALLYLLSALLLFDSSWFSFIFLYAVLSFAGHGAGRWLRRMIEREQTAGKNV